MKVICLLLLLVVAASAFQECGKKGSGIIGKINGKIENAGHGEFPWQISLRYKMRGKWVHRCGGTLIGKQWVLCAAHCFSGPGLDHNSPHKYIVRTGEWHMDSFDGSETDYKVSRIILHEEYHENTRESNDIALIKLEKPVNFDGPYVGPACLPKADRDYRGTKNCITSGWGPAFIKKANQLQKVSGKIWAYDDVLAAWGPNGGPNWGHRLPDHVIGFGEPGKWSSCMGESGGPLVCPNGEGSYEVAGIVSFGAFSCIDSHNSTKPLIYTEVSQYRDWLYHVFDHAV